MKNKITYVGGGGGGPACYSHIGAIKELLKHDKKIVNYIGTSAGSIIGAYIATKIIDNKKITTTDLNILANQNFPDMKDSNILGTSLFYLNKLIGKTPINRLGLFKGDNLLKYLKKITKNYKFKDIPNTFNLYITATEILTGNLIIFSKEHTPNVTLADACRASSSIQGFFIPHGIAYKDCVMFEDNSYKKPMSQNSLNILYSMLKNNYECKNKNEYIYLIDGGNLGNCRCDIATNIKCEDTDIIGVTFTQNGTNITEISSYVDILTQTISIMMKGQEKLVQKYTSLKNENIYMLTPNTFNIDTTDFDISHRHRQLLMKSAQESILSII